MSAANVIRDEMVLFALPDGGRGLAVLPSIPEDAPYRIREGIARRRITATTGECPCGARFDYDAAKAGEVRVAEVCHNRPCPADTASLVKAVRRWLR